MLGQLVSHRFGIGGVRGKDYSWLVFESLTAFPAADPNNDCYYFVEHDLTVI